MKNSLRSKLIYSFILIIIVVSASAFWAVTSLRGLSRSIDNIMQLNYNSIEAAQNMALAIERQDSFELAYMFSEDSESLVVFVENQQTFLKWFSRAEDNITEKNEGSVIERIDKSYAKYLIQFNSLLFVKQSQGADAAAAFYYSDILGTFEIIKSDLRELQDINQKAMIEKKERAHENSQSASFLTLASSLITLSMIALIAIYTTLRIIKPIYSLIDNVKVISTGDYSKKIAVRGNDEVAELSKEFNIMLERLSYFESINIKRIVDEGKKSEAIVKSIEDPMVVTDKDNHIILINESAKGLFSINADESTRRHFLELIKNDDIFSNIMQAIETNVSCTITELGLMNNQSQSYYKVFSNPIKDQKGFVLGVITLLQDITGLKEVDNLKSEFVSTVSHEFRSPLTSIIMGTDLMLSESIGEINEDQKEMIGAIKEDGERLKTLVTDLLDLSKLQSGKIIYDMKRTDIKDIINSSLSSFRTLIQTGEADIKVDIPDNAFIVIADASKLTLVLNNLISNAVKFSASGKAADIKIIVKSEDQLMYIMVEDKGIGIPAEYRDKIFEKFVQIPDPTQKREGSGLGLSICRQIITAHGGKLWVENAEPHGSRFIFTLNKKT